MNIKLRWSVLNFFLFIVVSNLLVAANEQGLSLAELVTLINRPYNHLSMLGSHNSFSSTAYAYKFDVQQRTNLFDQMSTYYTRAITLDVWMYGKDSIHVCHSKCNGAGMNFVRPGKANGEALDVYLKEIVAWIDGSKGPKKDFARIDVPRLGEAKEALHLVNNVLASGKQELPQTAGYQNALKTLNYIVRTPPVITIIFEDRVSGPKYFNDNGKALDRYIEKAGLDKYVLKPADWDPVAQKGWPSLAWMMQNNKSVIVFTDEPWLTSKYVYPQWVNMVESQYSQMLPAKVCQERAKDPNGSSFDSINYRDLPRYLYMINRFPKEDVLGTRNFKKENRKNGDAIEYCFVNGLSPDAYAKGRYPNIMMIDNVHAGDTYEVALKKIWDEYVAELTSRIKKQQQEGLFLLGQVGLESSDSRFKEGQVFDIPLFAKLQAPIPTGFKRGELTPQVKLEAEEPDYKKPAVPSVEESDEVEK